MGTPEIADRQPRVVDLEPGVYFWCACGRSADQPYCDGSHRGSGLAPVRFELTVPCNVALCMCKRTAGQPYCDGSHAHL